ncbi:helix-turn-helix domain-containing protein [Neisseria chenwenguii]|uniref:helix-turn-helix domain-containing protein n=1 Tax=Neisseria chenwenguii TaxID=1853278 RepID=UPI001E46FC6E|nr:helix-turn-helix transcriptional regulator [Neisseria chenwenguii]
MAVNDKIRALRELNNWSQEDMAERMNISKSSYSRLERDESKLEFVKIGKTGCYF